MITTVTTVATFIDSTYHMDDSELVSFLLICRQVYEKKF